MKTVFGKIQFLQGSQVGTFEVVLNGLPIGEVQQHRDSGHRFWVVCEEPTTIAKTREASAIKFIRQCNGCVR